MVKERFVTKFMASSQKIAQETEKDTTATAGSPY
jgi:hypothetical protein